MKYLLDSNIISEPSKPFPNEKVLNLLSTRRKDCVISSITFFEMLYGVLKLSNGKRKDILLSYLNEIVVPFYKILSYDFNAAKMHAQISSELEKIGLKTPFVDTQIASVAISNNLVLVTRNVKDFENIKNAFQLKIENWFEK